MKSTKAYRFKDNPQEKIFFDEWNQQHTAKVGESYSILEYLLAENPNQPLNECTDRDEYVAVLLIQWLGSPVGISFLKSCGFVPEKVDD